MFCASCGSHIKDDSRYCPNCGAAVDLMPPQSEPYGYGHDYFDAPPQNIQYQNMHCNVGTQNYSEPVRPAEQNQPVKTNTVAIVGFSLSLVMPVIAFILSTFLETAIGWIYALSFCFYFTIAGLVCSIIGLTRAKKGAPYRGLALAGVIISAISLAIGLIAIVSIFMRIYMAWLFAIVY